MKLFYLLSVAILINTANATAQGMAVNTTGAAANTSAMLDVSSTTQGMLVPRMAAAQRTLISSPAQGLLVYQTDAPIGFYFYNSGWSILGGGAPTGSAGGDLTGTYPNPTIATGAVTGSKIAGSTIGVGNLSAGGTASSTTFHRGDNTWSAPFALTTSGTSGAATFSGGILNIPTPATGGGGGGINVGRVTTVSGTNLAGNGTLYVGVAGWNATESDNYFIVPVACTQVTLMCAASGALTTPYAITARLGTNTGSGYSFADIAGTSLSLSDATVRTVTITGLSIPAGSVLSIKSVGTANINVNGGKSLYFALTAK